MIFYFTATGNSLYAARQIGGGDELVSIAQELRKEDRHYKDDVNSLRAGLEGGLGLENFQDIHPGDIIESYRIDEVARTE